MTSFIVRFVVNVPGAFRGMVRHVRTGEESAFSSPADLLRFFERLKAVEGIEPEEIPREPTRKGEPWITREEEYPE